MFSHINKYPVKQSASPKMTKTWRPTPILSLMNPRKIVPLSVEPIISEKEEEMNKLAGFLPSSLQLICESSRKAGQELTQNTRRTAAGNCGFFCCCCNRKWFHQMRKGGGINARPNPIPPNWRRRKSRPPSSVSSFAVIGPRPRAGCESIFFSVTTPPIAH
jgi:hypothetical protein